MKRICLWLILLCSMHAWTCTAQPVSLIGQGSAWKYLADGSNQGTAWQATAFADAAWPSGNAQLGYGDGDEATVIPYGPNANNRYITYYFRKSFSIANPAVYSSLLLELLRDDGAIVYLNGTEVMRSNMPSGAVTYTTLASVLVSGTDENTFFTASPAVSLLVAGTNVIAVEVHQVSASNTDVSFDLKLSATPQVSCGIPSGLASSNIKSNSALLSWSAVPNAVSYHVQYRKSGNINWKDTTLSGTSVKVKGLSASSTYEWKVQSVCTGGTSVFSTASIFITPFNCKVPVLLPVSNAGSGSVTLNWNPVNGAAAYSVQYRKLGNSAWINTSSVTTSLTIGGLLAATTYEWKVMTQCTSNTSAYSAKSIFTTPAACATPAGLAATSILASSAILNWTAVNGASGYYLQYRAVGSGLWAVLPAASNTVTVSGLSPAVSYECQVQSACAGGNSPFSASLFITIPAAGTDTFVVTNATGWKYLDNGSNQGTAWRSPQFNDGSWSSGQAEFGYGDGDEKTIVSYGPDPNNKYITTYFRRPFTVSNPLAYSSLRLGVVRDDGIVVYLNGNEIYRNNMPAGVISSTTLASVNILNADEYTWYTAALDPALLASGTNVLAVEVHQQFLSSADISFNCRLYASGPSLPSSVERGAYLQKVTPSSITVRWRTDIETTSQVQYGTAVALGSAVTDNSYTKEHIVTLTGLAPHTRYYYSVGTMQQVLQGDTNNTFITAPVAGSTVPVRIWATGDFGNGSASQDNVRNAYMNYAGAGSTNLWIWLGDNAYSTGTDAEYQANVFNKYPVQLKQFPLHPAIGNHDYGNAGYQSASVMGTAFPYFSSFSVFTAGEGGGVPSNTPKYYSYNYANIHFIALDSYGALNTPGSPMVNWLQSDLAANTQEWTIVYFHHTPYTKGTHDSDTDIELINMRNNIVPLLENYHVDLVLCGHSHINERSYLIKGHHGLANTFTNSMKVSTATNTFLKSAPFDGTIYAVCGTSGQNPGPTQNGYPMPCMYFSNNTNNCSLVLDVNGNNLSMKYLTSTGSVADQVTITKTGPQMQVWEKQNDLEVVYLAGENRLSLRYYLESGAEPEFDLFNLLGEPVPLPGTSGVFQDKGFYRTDIPLTGSLTGGGLFFIRMKTGNQVLSRKVVIVR